MGGGNRAIWLDSGRGSLVYLAHGRGAPEALRVCVSVLPFLEAMMRLKLFPGLAAASRWEGFCRGADFSMLRGWALLNRVDSGRGWRGVCVVLRRVGGVKESELPRPGPKAVKAGQGWSRLSRDFGRWLWGGCGEPAEGGTTNASAALADELVLPEQRDQGQSRLINVDPSESRRRESLGCGLRGGSRVVRGGCGFWRSETPATAIGGDADANGWVAGTCERHGMCGKIRGAQHPPLPQTMRVNPTQSDSFDIALRQTQGLRLGVTVNPT
jgi:hypothetical protein